MSSANYICKQYLGSSSWKSSATKDTERGLGATFVHFGPTKSILVITKSKSQIELNIYI